LSKIEQAMRDVVCVVIIAVAIVPVTIFALFMLIFDRSPPFKHGPYNGHQSPHDI
jgi:hypothetical protein